MGISRSRVLAAYLRDSVHLTQEETRPAVTTHEPPNLWEFDLVFSEGTDRNGHATH